MRLGIFGGTFDPLHLGHLILAAEALDQLSLDRILFVLTPNPPHKQGRQITPVQHRVDMLQAVLSGNPAFEISQVEMDHPAPHYAIDTVCALRRQFPPAELVYLMGADSLVDLPAWHQYQDFVDELNVLGVMRRPGESVDLLDLDTQIPGIIHKVRYIDAPLLEISSSEIRQRVSERRPFRYYLPMNVYQIIMERQLYQYEPHTR